MNIIEMLIRDEGLCLHPYKCTAGKTTIGIGRNLDDNGITPEEAEMMADNDVRNVISELKISRVASIVERIGWQRRAAIVNMGFNMGVPRLLTFKRMWAALAEGDYDTAADEAMDSIWYRQVGDRGPRVVAVIRNGNLESYDA